MSLPAFSAGTADEWRGRSRPVGVEPEWMWPEPLADPERRQARLLERQLGLHPLVAEILVRRGLKDPEEAYLFLHPSLDQLEDPFRLPGMEEAVTRIERSLARGEPIWVYGDYDVDGQTGTALLVEVLGRLGARVAYHVPNRVSEGYGLHRETLLDLRSRGAALVVTVDCGTTARDEVEEAARAGLDVVVTDHHQVPPELPRAAALVNPRLAEGSPPWKELSGAGVAWKLAQALLQRAGRGEEAFAYLDLVALGTVADVVPLLDENRILVTHGLRRLAGSECRPGLARMLQELGLEGGPITPGQVAFQIAPRLNAAGRVEDASLGVRLLLAPSAAAAAPLVDRLEKLNRERQALEEAILAEARAQALEAVEEGAVSLVVAGEGWHPGVVGIVASRLVEEFYRPALVIGLEGGQGRGSARSIAGFHLYDALAACRAHLTRFGGHAMAAGFSLAEASVPALRKAFERVTRERLGPQPLRPRLRVECVADPAELGEGLLEQMERLGPFGVGNPGPVLGTAEVPGLAWTLPSWSQEPATGRSPGWGPIPAWRRVGKAREHLKGAMPIFPSGRLVEAIGFGLAARVPEEGGWLDLAYQPARNSYQGSERLELRLREVRLSPRDGGDGWASLAAWAARQAMEGPLLLPDRTETTEQAAAASAGCEVSWELVDERGRAEGLPDTGEPAALCTPDLWEAVELVQALRWRLKDQREQVAFLGPLDRDLFGEEPPAYVPKGGARLAVALDPSVLATTGEGPVILWSPPWTLAGWRHWGRCLRGRRLVLRFSRSRVQRLQLQVEMLHPGRQRLASLYRYLKECPGLLHPVEAAARLTETQGLPFSARTVREGLAILAELALLRWEEAGGGTVAVQLAPHPGRKLDLGRSVRYTKGIRRKQEFAAISEIALFGGLARMQELLRGGAGPWTSSG